MATKRNVYEATPTRDDDERYRKPLITSTTDSSSPESAVAAVPGSGSGYRPVPTTEPNVKSELLLEESQVEAPEVKDKFFIVYGIFLLFGIATLLPWNIFINATDYFKNYKLNTTESYNTTYREKFTFITGMIGQVTNVIMNMINVFIACGGDPKKRVPWTIAISSSVMIFHIILAAINSESWSRTFFILCCVSVFVMYVATGILQSCVYFVASILPMEYTNGIILGSNLAGIFTSVMSILSKATSPSPKIAAIFYFLAAFIALALAFVGYFLMHRMKFYRTHEEIARNKKRDTDNADGSSARPPYWAIFKKIWLLLFCIWLNFFSTLCIFPVYLLGVQPNNPDFLKSDEVSWFQDIVTFLTFNVAVTIGNLIPRLIKRPGPKFIPIPVIARAAIVFLFFAFCNFKPEERTLPVLISNDWGYWVACAISPLVFGYLTSLLMMYTPRQVEPQHAGTAAMLSSLALVIGVTTGLNFVIVYEKLVLINYGGGAALSGPAALLNSTLVNATSI